jgi:thiamine transporter ThiT
MRNPLIRNLTLSAMFLAIGLVLPFLTGQIPQIGSMLSPLHIPVFLCGLICGWKYGLAVGFILPLMRSLIFTMPPLMPTAVAMAFEMAVYGLVIGLAYAKLPKNIGFLYVSLIAAMVSGRMVWGVATLILMGVQGNAFTWNAFIAGAFLNAIPGIVLHIILIPSVMVLLMRTGLVDDGRSKTVY